VEWEENNLYWHEDRPEKFFKEMAAKVDADIMIYGHTHKPYRRDIGENRFIFCKWTSKSKSITVR